MAQAPRLQPLRLAGILLAAGKGARFDPRGNQNKLLQMLPHGEGVALTAARHLSAVLPTTLVAVRPGADALAAQLRQAGFTVAVCPTAEQGMGATLAFALTQLRDADGWLIALADMPYLRPATLQALVDALHQGADIAVPVFQSRRGNPVGFSRKHLAQLLSLGGDQGARDLLKAHPLTEVVVDDPGVTLDIDIPADLT